MELDVELENAATRRHRGQREMVGDHGVQEKQKPSARERGKAAGRHGRCEARQERAFVHGIDLGWARLKEERASHAGNTV
jgi:hypothetical protein